MWGADPLEYYGGFRSLDFSHHETFPSSLGSSGVVKWKRLSSSKTVRKSNSVTNDLVITWPEIEWEALKAIYGWAVLQYQAWIRGKLTLQAQDRTTVLLFVDHALELWLDGVSYFGGDFYGFRRTPLVLWLEPGEHRLDIRVVRDVRAMGGLGDPCFPMAITADISTVQLFVGTDTILIPELVEGHGFAGRAGSIPLRNQIDEWIEILSIETQEVRATPLEPSAC